MYGLNIKVSEIETVFAFTKPHVRRVGYMMSPDV